MRVYLAGCEPKHFAAAARLTGHPYQLISYYHFSRSSEKDRQWIIDHANKHNLHIIIDSGLFTMMFGANKDQKFDLADMKLYTQKYIEDVKGYGFKNFTIVECDVHKILGMDAVFTLRHYFKQSGLDVIYVWHREEGIPGLIEMAEEYDYIALSVPELRLIFKGKNVKYQSAIYNLLAKIRNEVKNFPRIHLLGNTVQETMENKLAYSCDSTSWLMAGKFANGYFYRNGCLVKAHIRSKAYQEYRDKVMNDYPDFGKFLNEIMATAKNPEKLKEYISNNFISAKAYANYQTFLDRSFTWVGDRKHQEAKDGLK